jgi:hypothetical protein
MVRVMAAENIIESFKVVKRSDRVVAFPIQTTRVSDEVAERIKGNMKDVGYKYVGRFKDTYDNTYTQYEKRKESSSKECEVIYRIKITRLV